MNQGSFKAEVVRTENCTERIYDQHCHSRYELIFVLDGSIRINVEGEHLLLEKGTGIIVEPLKYHIITGNNTRYHRLILFFGEDFIPLQIRQKFFENINNYYIFFSNEDDSFFKKYATILERRNSIYAPLLDAILTEAIYALALDRHVREENIKDKKMDKIKQIISYIDMNLQNEIRLEDVAASVYMSESSVCHLFRDEMNTSLKRYILQKKMAYAKSLLLCGVSPGEVALSCGYKNYASFYKMFLKVTGRTPAEVSQIK